MTSRLFLWLILAALSMTAAIVTALTGMTGWAIGSGCVALAALAVTARSIMAWQRTSRAGMSLLRSRDFASRLCSTGFHEADELVELFNDLISRLKAERLRSEEQEAYLEKLVEASPMGVALADFDGNITRTNPAFDALRSPETDAALAALEEDTSTTLRIGSAQVVRLTRRWLMDRGFRRPFFLIERLTDEIVAAERNVFAKVVRTMGHEVNNTLGSVVSVLETLEMINAGDEAIGDAVRSSAASCRALAAFVRGYSSIVKLPAAQLEPGDFRAFIHGLEPHLRGLCHDGISLAITDTGTGKGARPSFDPVLMERVMVNVVKNAMESIAATGRADGRVELTVDGYGVTVTDNGAGISPEAASKVFTPFFSTKAEGRGLGLMLVTDIVGQHPGATVSLTTGTDGLTRFSLQLGARN